MVQTSPKKCLVPLVGFAFFMLIGISATAQTSELQYKVIKGQVYAYETKNPAEMYLLPNANPEQFGLTGTGDSMKEEANQNTVRNAVRASPYVAEQGVYGLPNTVVPIRAQPAVSNDALPTITFREPQTSTRSRIDGLPVYPGKNYPASN